MTEAPGTAALAAAFGLTEVSDDSLSPWSPVHRAIASDGPAVVVKRTSSRAEAMASWTRALAAAGVPVVTPEPLEKPNPQRVGEEQFVVYPFVPGRPYDVATDSATLGDLLGRLHAADVPAEVLGGLRDYAFPETEREDVDGDLETLSARLPAMLGPEEGERAVAAVRALAERWWVTALPALKAADAAGELPRAGVSSDYKAANVVIGQEGPVLVDPDNGGHEPRLFDLAMAAVLLHHESPSAPARLQDAREWDAFVRAYLAHVELTERERELWPHAVDHMLWEEGTWALEDNDEDAWADIRQGGYLRALAVAVPEDFPLPRRGAGGLPASAESGAAHG